MLVSLPAIIARASAPSVVERANARRVDHIELIAPKPRESEAREARDVNARQARDGAIRAERMLPQRPDRRLPAILDAAFRREPPTATAAYAAQDFAQARSGARLHLENWRGAIGAYARAAMLIDRPAPAPESVSLLV
jgi:hypothetical protein